MLILSAILVLMLAEHLFSPGLCFSAHTRVLKPWRNDLTPEAQDQALSKLNHTATDKNFSFHPDNIITSQAFQQGRLPLWNPYQMGGVPHLGQSLYGIFYPLNLPMFLFDQEQWFLPLTALHFLMTGFFTYLFLRRQGLGFSAALLGGVVMMCCANMTSRFHYYMTIFPMAWAPLMLILTEKWIQERSRLSLCGLSLLGAQVILAGFQQVAVYVFYLCLGYSLFLSAKGIYRIRFSRGFKYGLLFSSLGVGILYLVWTPDLWGAYALGSFLFVTGFLAGGRGFLRWILANLPVVCALILSVGLAAIQMVPVLSQMSHSTRALLSPHAMTAGNCLHNMGWLGFIFPMLMTDPTWSLSSTCWNLPALALTGISNLNYVEDTLYLGVLPIFLLFFLRPSPSVRFFSGAAIISFCLVFGFSLVVYPAWLIPGFQLDPRRILVVLPFILSVLCAFGFDRLISRVPKRKLMILGCVFMGLGILFALLAYLFNMSLAKFFLNLAKDNPEFLKSDFTSQMLLENGEQIRSAFLHFSMAAASAGIALLLLAYRPGNLAMALVFLAILVDLVPLFWYANRPQDPEDFLKVHPSIAIIKKPAQDPNFRIFRFTDPSESQSGSQVPLPPNMTTNFGIQDCQGYIVQPLTRFYRLVNGIQPNLAGPRSWILPITDFKYLNSPILDLVGAKYILSTKPIPENFGFKLLYDKNRNYVYENPRAFPRAFMVSKVIFKELENPKPMKLSSVLEEMLSSDLKKIAVAETEPLELPVPDGPLPNTRVSYPYPERVEVSFDGPNPGGVLVLTDAYYPGWRAFIDGKETGVFPVDLAFRGVLVPKGCEKVVLEFHPKEVGLGIIISGACLALLLIAALLCLTCSFCTPRPRQTGPR